MATRSADNARMFFHQCMSCTWVKYYSFHRELLCAAGLWAQGHSNTWMCIKCIYYIIYIQIIVFLVVVQCASQQHNFWVDFLSINLSTYRDKIVSKGKLLLTIKWEKYCRNCADERSKQTNSTILVPLDSLSTSCCIEQILHKNKTTVRIL